jgi:hypothetical protein
VVLEWDDSIDSGEEEFDLAWRGARTKRLVSSFSFFLLFDEEEDAAEDEGEAVFDRSSATPECSGAKGGATAVLLV